MANEFRHESTAAGTSCSQADWEDTDIHRFQGQAQGDIAYASTNTQISRLAIGSTGQVLEVSGGLPSWQAKGFSSTCNVYMGTEQVCPDNQNVEVFFDTEEWDTDGEFDNRNTSGAADATEANKLHDADGGFEAADVGRIVWNTTDDTYATVTAFVDAGELTLDADIMVNGENYTLFGTKFTATAAGKYLICLVLYIKQTEVDKTYVARITQNGSSISYSKCHSSSAITLSTMVTQIANLSANDYVEAWFWHNSVAAVTLDNLAKSTGYMSIHRIA